MKALLDYLPLIIFFYFYKTTDPKDSHHPLLELVGSAGNIDQNHILVSTCALLISTLVVYGCLFFFHSSRASLGRRACWQSPRISTATIRAGRNQRWIMPPTHQTLR